MQSAVDMAEIVGAPPSAAPSPSPSPTPAPSPPVRTELDSIEVFFNGAWPLD